MAVDDLDWGAVGDVELEPAVIATLVYMRDVEGFTPSYLTGLGAHRTTHRDPLIRDFLAVWVAEEQAHADAIDRFLTHYGEARGVVVPAPQPAPEAGTRWYERLVARVGGPVGTVVAASHMAWGAANELLTMNGYRLLADRTPDPVLADLLRRIAAQEARHYSFYLLQAEWRLAASPTARRALRHVLQRGWTPVGIGDGYKTPEEFRQVLDHLTAPPDAHGVVARMDRRISALPGLSGLEIYQRAFQ